MAIDKVAVYTNIPGRPLEYASTILACLSVVVIAPIYVFYRKGPQIREKSPFAQSLNTSRQNRDAQKRKSIVAGQDVKKAKTETELNERV